MAFFREAKFETLPMHPFLDQYLPTDRARNAEDRGMLDAKTKASKQGMEWTSQYLFHIPLEKKRRKKTEDEELNELADEEDSEHLDDPIGKGRTKLPHKPRNPHQ